MWQRIYWWWWWWRWYWCWCCWTPLDADRTGCQARNPCQKHIMKHILLLLPSHCTTRRQVRTLKTRIKNVQCTRIMSTLARLLRFAFEQVICIERIWFAADWYHSCIGCETPDCRSFSWVGGMKKPSWWGYGSHLLVGHLVSYSLRKLNTILNKSKRSFF